MKSYSLQKLAQEMVSCHHAILRCQLRNKKGQGRFLVQCITADENGDVLITCDDARMIPLLTADAAIPVYMKFADKEMNKYFTIMATCEAAQTAVPAFDSMKSDKPYFKIKATEVKHYVRKVYAPGISFLLNTGRTVFTKM